MAALIQFADGIVITFAAGILVGSGAPGITATGAGGQLLKVRDPPPAAGTCCRLSFAIACAKAFLERAIRPPGL